MILNFDIGEMPPEINECFRVPPFENEFLAFLEDVLLVNDSSILPREC